MIKRLGKKLAKIRKEPQLVNQSAVNSLDEGLEETLTLQRFGLFQALGKSFKTANCIESLMAPWVRRPTRWIIEEQWSKASMVGCRAFGY